MKISGLFFKPTDNQMSKREILIQDLGRVKRQIHQVDILFNLADDPELIDSYIYELNSLRKQYNFLIATYRENERKQNEIQNI